MIQKPVQIHINDHTTLKIYICPLRIVYVSLKLETEVIAKFLLISLKPAPPRNIKVTWVVHTVYGKDIIYTDS